MCPSSKAQNTLRLIDLLSLIAVVGVALTMTRSYVRCFSVLNSLVSTEPSNVRVMGVRECLYACVPLLVLLSAVLLPLRLARPWRRFRRIARLPGLTVSYAAAVALVFALAWAGLDQRTRLWNTHFADIGVLTLGDTLVLRVIATKDMIGSAVAVTWLILWFGGGWRPEPTWIDRLGRFLGAFWVVFGVALWVDSVVRR